METYVKKLTKKVKWAIEGCVKTHGPKDPQTLSAVSQLATLLWTQGRLKEAEDLFREVLDGSEEILGRS